MSNLQVNIRDRLFRMLRDDYIKSVRWVVDPETQCWNWPYTLRRMDTAWKRKMDGQDTHIASHMRKPTVLFLRGTTCARFAAIAGAAILSIFKLRYFPNRTMRATATATKRTEENWAIAQQLRASGKSYQEIRRLIGINASTVRSWLKGSYVAALNVRLLKAGH
jgi:Homeodomain-like domain